MVGKSGYKEGGNSTDRAEFVGDESKGGLKLEEGSMKVYNDRKGFWAEDCSYIDSALRYHIDMVYGLIEVVIDEPNIYVYYFLKR